jgi:hypothetical protein
LVRPPPRQGGAGEALIRAPWSNCTERSTLNPVLASVCQLRRRGRGQILLIRLRTLGAIESTWNDFGSGAVLRVAFARSAAHERPELSREVRETCGQRIGEVRRPALSARVGQDVRRSPGAGPGRNTVLNRPAYPALRARPTAQPFGQMKVTGYSLRRGIQVIC